MFGSNFEGGIVNQTNQDKRTEKRKISFISSRMGHCSRFYIKQCAAFFRRRKHDLWIEKRCDEDNRKFLANVAANRAKGFSSEAAFDAATATIG